MRGDDENIGAIARHAVDLRHGPRHVPHMLDDVRHEDAGKAVAFERPRVLVQVPDYVGGRIGRAVDAHRGCVLLPGSTTDIERVCVIDHELLVYQLNLAVMRAEDEE